MKIIKKFETKYNIAEQYYNKALSNLENDYISERSWVGDDYNKLRSTIEGEFKVNIEYIEQEAQNYIDIVSSSMPQFSMDLVVKVEKKQRKAN